MTIHPILYRATVQQLCGRCTLHNVCKCMRICSSKGLRFTTRQRQVVHDASGNGWLHIGPLYAETVGRIGGLAPLQINSTVPRYSLHDYGDERKAARCTPVPTLCQQSVGKGALRNGMQTLQLYAGLYRSFNALLRLRPVTWGCFSASSVKSWCKVKFTRCYTSVHSCHCYHYTSLHRSFIRRFKRQLNISSTNRFHPAFLVLHFPVLHYTRPHRFTVDYSLCDVIQGILAT